MFSRKPPKPDAARWRHRRYAIRHGFFWMPCPMCGRYTGGHEWSDIGELRSVIYVIGDREGLGHGICRKCTLAGKGGKTYLRSHLHFVEPQNFTE